MAVASSTRRDAVIALVSGPAIAIALNIWYNHVANLQTIDSYLWLARVHEPAGSIAERLALKLYPSIGYPWCVRWALACGYLLLIGMWVAAVFLALRAWRLSMSLWCKFVS
jgi:hypothetical protein